MIPEDRRSRAFEKAALCSKGDSRHSSGFMSGRHNKENSYNEGDSNNKSSGLYQLLTNNKTMGNSRGNLHTGYKQNNDQLQFQ